MLQLAFKLPFQQTGIDFIMIHYIDASQNIHFTEGHLAVCLCKALDI